MRVQIEFTDGVYQVILNRPEVHNAFDAELIQELTQKFLALPEGTRILVLKSSGPSFCAGADLNWMKQMANYSEIENKQDAALLFDLFYALSSCPVPTVALVRGPALGGGAGLVAAADLALATESASFGFTEARLGLIPAVISPFVIRKIGQGQALAYFLTASSINANRAMQIGLVHEVCTEGEFEAKTDSMLKTLLKNGPQAMRSVKTLLNRQYPSLIALKEELSQTIAQIRVSSEGQEGLQAFLNKRKPNWAG